MEKEELMTNTDQTTGGGVSRVLSPLAGIFGLLTPFLRRLLGLPPRLPTPIEHVVVLMYENRSFDHMLGFLPEGGGLSGDEFNLVDPSNPASEKVPVGKGAGYVDPVDPAHDFISVATQLYGAPGQVSDPAPMSGFVKAYIQQSGGDVENGKKIMRCFDPEQLPALRTLAQEFCLCNRWFSGLPGPTWPNRFFAHAATSDGQVGNDVLHPFNMKTIYNSMAESGYSWNIYFSDIPQSLALRRLWGSLDHFRPMYQFHSDVQNGKLANYIFIEPRYFSFFEWKANDQHPPHDVRQGEYLLAEVYETLRNSPLWEKTLLVVLYDEHGGFFDEVPPPTGVPNPDGQNSNDPLFDFTRLGVRVPALLVSPYIEKGRLDSSVYEHSSLLATTKKLFNLPGFLTARDRTANTFEKNLSRSTPRTDAPLSLPVPGTPVEAQASRQLLRTDPRQRAAQGLMDTSEASHETLSEFQQTLVDLANGMGAQLPAAAPALTQPTTPTNENDAAQHVQDTLAQLLGSQGEK
jgi:phospholipase C